VEEVVVAVGSLLVVAESQAGAVAAVGSLLVVVECK
jgi:hypothetical protein